LHVVSKQQSLIFKSLEANEVCNFLRRNSDVFLFLAQGAEVEEPKLRFSQRRWSFHQILSFVNQIAEAAAEARRVCLLVR
jgi:hypothetical protein